MSHPRHGSRVAHRALDGHSGGALAGVVEEVIGEDPALVVVKDPSGERVAYDERELRRLHRVPLLSRGPVILRPHHLWRLLTGRRRAV